MFVLPCCCVDGMRVDVSVAKCCAAVAVAVAVVAVVCATG